MSRGTRQTQMRLSVELLARVDAEVARMNDRLRNKKWNRTEWVRQAIEERLDKLARGRKNAYRQRPGGDQTAGQVEQVAGQVEQVEQVAGQAGEGQNDGTDR